MRLRRALVLIPIVLALLLNGARNGSASNQTRDQSHAAKTDEYAASSQNQQPVAPAFFAAILGELRDMISEEVAKQEQEHADHEDWNTKPFWLMFGLNAALVLVGGGYLIFMYLQRSDAQETLNAIKNQAEIAERELIITNRAYLYLSGVRINLYKADQHTAADEETMFNYVITYPIYNGGQTPALYVGAFARVAVDYKAPQEVSQAALALDLPQNAVVPPRGAEPLLSHYRSFLSKKEFTDLQAGQHSLFFYGVLTYFDMFDKKRHTWFALSHNGRIGTEIPMQIVIAHGLNRFD
jgi:hypothetical protein